MLDCISNFDLYQLINANIHGGFCLIGQCSVKTNNKGTNHNFDGQKIKYEYSLYNDLNSSTRSYLNSLWVIEELCNKELENFK